MPRVYLSRAAAWSLAREAHARDYGFAASSFRAGSGVAAQSVWYVRTKGGPSMSELNRQLFENLKREIWERFRKGDPLFDRRRAAAGVRRAQNRSLMPTTALGRLL